MISRTFKRLIRSYKRKLAIWEADYGRSEGWLLEYNGEVIARLVDGKTGDMFWEYYVLVPTSRANELGIDVESGDFWRYFDFNHLRFRSKRIKECAKYPIPSAGPHRKGERIGMRGLYLTVPAARRWDTIPLYFYRKRQQKINAKRQEHAAIEMMLRP